MNYETLRAKYGDVPDSIESGALLPPEEDVREEKIDDAVAAPAAKEQGSKPTELKETEKSQVTAPATVSVRKTVAVPKPYDETKTESIDERDPMLELEAQMTRIEHMLNVLSRNVEYVKQISARAATKEAAPMTAVAAKLEELRQVSARQEKANIDILRDSKNFQATVREQMQRELDGYHKMHSETANAPILTDIANLYIASSKAISYLTNDKERSNIAEIVLEGLLEILEDRGVEVNSTPIGVKRSSKNCKTRKTVPTGDQALHGMVAASHNPSFTLGKQILIKENVDTYIYDPALAPVKEVQREDDAAEDAVTEEVEETVVEETVTEEIAVEGVESTEKVPAGTAVEETAAVPAE